MHASLLLIGVFLMFSRHITAAPSDNRGLDEPPGYTGKHPDHGTQSPEITDFGFEIPTWNTTVPTPEEEQPDDPPKHLEKGKRDKDSDYKQCRPLDQKKFLSREIMIDAVDKFCEHAHGRAQDKNTRGVSRTYNSGTPDEVDISVDWDPGLDDKKPNKDDCLRELTWLVDNCSVPDKDKKFNLENLKAGGSRRVGVFTYRILPVKDEDEKKEDDKKKDKKKDKTDRHDMKCRPLKENKYLFYDVMVYAVEAFCEDIGEQDDRDKDSEGIFRRYFQGTTDEVRIGVEFPSGSKPDHRNCKKELMNIVNDCSVPAGNDNKNNVKAGGKLYRGQTRYGIIPEVQRHDYNKPKAAICVCNGFSWGIRCNFQGRGWSTNDRAGKLEHEIIEGCNEMNIDRFNMHYITDGSDREFEGYIDMNLGQSACVAYAMEKAGSPKVKCENKG